MKNTLILNKPKNYFSKINVLKRVVGFVFNVFLILIIVSTVIFIIYITNARKNGGNISLGEYRLFNIISGSMEPTIPVGSTVVSKKVDGKSIKKGDIISFKSGSIIITHRVTDIYTQNNTIRVYTTKGDSNDSIDNNPVFDDQILGKVNITIPYLGYVFNFVTTKRGMFITIIIPLFFTFFYDIIIFFIELNKYIDYRESTKN